jgi:hypothetical protein
MASHNKPAVSDIPKLGDTIFGWQGDQVEQTLSALPFAVKETNQSLAPPVSSKRNNSILANTTAKG